MVTFHYTFVAEDVANCITWFRTILQPFKRFIFIKRYVFFFFGHRVVPSDLFDDAAVSRAAGISDYDTVVWISFGTHACQSKFNCHWYVDSFLYLNFTFITISEKQNPVKTFLFTGFVFLKWQSHVPERILFPAFLTCHLLHHLFHFIELLEQPVHFLQRSAGTAGDALFAACIDLRWILAFIHRHGTDDGLHMIDLIAAHLHLVKTFDLVCPRHHLEQFIKRAEILDLIHLFQEIIQSEALILDFLLQHFLLVFIHGRLRFFDDGQRVPPAESPLCQTSRMERLQTVHLLGQTRK